MTKIRHEDMMTEVEICRLFSMIGTDGKLRDIRPPRRKRSSKRVRPVWTDTLKEGVSTAPPGRGRVKDLIRFYAANAASETSAFEF
jgi:hypothetical protein